MTGWELFKSSWDWEPTVVGGCAALLASYLTAVRLRFDKKTVYFTSGMAVLFLALVSPLDALGDDYLFSAHMLQHILLDLVAPPLLLLGMPKWMFVKALRWPPAAWLERVARVPMVAWVLGAGTLWIWHLPLFYNATLESESIHVFEHLTFLVTGTIFWWPILMPFEDRRMAPVPAMVYLVLASGPNALLGIVLTLANTAFYSPYLHPKDELGALSLIRDKWGLEPVIDQQLGGALMWVIGSVVFFWGVMAMVGRHMAESSPAT